MERKKQQSIKEAVDKKEQQIKVQKSLNKSLHEKIVKLQEANKTLNKKKNESPRMNKTMQPSIPRQNEEVNFELSP